LEIETLANIDAKAIKCLAKGTIVLKLMWHVLEEVPESILNAVIDCFEEGDAVMDKRCLL